MRPGARRALRAAWITLVVMVLAVVGTILTLAGILSLLELAVLDQSLQLKGPAATLRA